MYLLDTNIFLEILLQREKSKAAKHLFIENHSTDLFLTDFSLHSIGVSFSKEIGMKPMSAS